MKISVKVYPQSKLNKVEKLSENSYKVFTTKPAQKNKANIAVVDLLSKYLKIKKSQVMLIAGSTSREKIIDVLN